MQKYFLEITNLKLNPNILSSRNFNFFFKTIATLFKSFASRFQIFKKAIFMKKIFLVFALFLGLGMLSSCHKHHDPKPHGDCKNKDKTSSDSTCNTLITAKNLEGLDGCGWMFVLEDGTKLLPIFSPTFVPITFKEGQQFKIAYKENTNVMTVCMAGKTVDILCLTEVKSN